MEQDWHGVVKTIVTNRVKNLTFESRVDRFLELERRTTTTHALITNIFMTEATAALDVLVFKKVNM